MSTDAVAPALLLARTAAEALVGALGARPAVAVVLGSGWRGAAEALGQAEAEVAMAELPGFRPPGVPGHGGSVRMVRVDGRAVLVLLGRSHLYEGCSAAEVVHGARAAVLAGAGVVVLTNAAGALNPAMRPGQVVVVRDHINLTGASPLAGPEPGPGFGPRFVDLTDLYSARLRRHVAAAYGRLPEGVYAAMAGPQYETPAEVTMLARAGADLVGMSTVLEAVAARHLGAEILAFSLVTNPAAGTTPVPLQHSEVLAAGEAAADELGGLLRCILPGLVPEPPR